MVSRRDSERGRRGGFSLVELLVVLCVVICLMALIVPNLWPIMQKSKNLKTLNRCKALSDAFMEYVVLHGGMPSADGIVDVSFYTAVSAQDVSDLLSPDFLGRVPAADAWNQPFEFYFNGVQGREVYAIRSAGSDSVFNGTLYSTGPFAINDPTDNDIVCADGEVVRWPEGWTP